MFGRPIYIDLLVMYIDLSMYSIIYVLTHCPIYHHEMHEQNFILKYC
jgi:hypothetical protein